ncbi:MAG: type II toxin-antitoxin system VapC family toxin [Phycisphaerales bacterium]
MTPASPALIDTDILSAIMRGNPSATGRARSYLEVHRQFTFSVITRYEVLRGLLAKKAARQLAAFDQLCAASRVLPVTDAVVVQAAGIYADLSQRGELVNDADILIAATALTQGLVVVTNNQSHFQRIQNLSVENWLA